MTKVLYNSALKSSTALLSDLKPLERFEHRRGTALTHDLTTGFLPAEFDACDVFYCEPPWPDGLKVFDKRSGNKTPSYDFFCDAFAQVWNDIQVPKFVIASKKLVERLEPPTATVGVKLNAHWVNLYCWGGRVPGGLNSRQIAFELGKRYRHLGDFCAGYGTGVRPFLSASKSNTFTISDYDPHCIDAFRRIISGEGK